VDSLGADLLTGAGPSTTLPLTFVDIHFLFCPEDRKDKLLRDGGKEPDRPIVEQVSTIEPVRSAVIWIAADVAIFKMIITIE